MTPDHIGLNELDGRRNSLDYYLILPPGDSRESSETLRLKCVRYLHAHLRPHADGHVHGARTHAQMDEWMEPNEKRALQ